MVRYLLNTIIFSSLSDPNVLSHKLTFAFSLYYTIDFHGFTKWLTACPNGGNCQHHDQYGTCLWNTNVFTCSPKGNRNPPPRRGIYRQISLPILWQDRGKEIQMDAQHHCIMGMSWMAKSRRSSRIKGRPAWSAGTGPCRFKNGLELHERWNCHV